MLKTHYKCYRCKEVKPIDQFASNPSCNPRPVKGYCNTCTATYRKEDPDHLEKERLRRRARGSQYQYTRTRAWKKANPARDREQSNRVRSKRDAIIRGANKADPIGLKDVYTRDKGICQLCGSICRPEEASIDHRIPLSRGGQHIWANVQLAHRKCNSLKGTTLV